MTRGVIAPLELLRSAYRPNSWVDLCILLIMCACEIELWQETCCNGGAWGCRIYFLAILLHVRIQERFRPPWPLKPMCWINNTVWSVWVWNLDRVKKLRTQSAIGHEKNDYITGRAEETSWQTYLSRDVPYCYQTYLVSSKLFNERHSQTSSPLPPTRADSRKRDSWHFDIDSSIHLRPWGVVRRRYGLVFVEMGLSCPCLDWGQCKSRNETEKKRLRH